MVTQANGKPVYEEPVLDFSKIPFEVQVAAAYTRWKARRDGEQVEYDPCTEATDWKLNELQQTVIQRLKSLKERRGVRYANCSFDNYVIKNDEQRIIVEALKAHANSLDCLERNVLLVGPKGTGKDHLLMALARAIAARFAECPVWMNGIELQELFRAEATGSFKTKIYRGFDDDERTTKIFWVSDPLPLTGALTEFQQTALFGVIDHRYSAMLPTWMTLNVADSQEAEMRMGAQNVDRLQHDALILACNWESYRSPKD